MPSLTNLTAWLYVKTYDRLDINLPFVEAGTMTLGGNISRYVENNYTLVYHTKTMLIVYNFQI